MTSVNHLVKDYSEYIRNVDANQCGVYNIAASFPADLANLSSAELIPVFRGERSDFRGEKAFTIDCENCKDMDDAVGLVKTGKGYRLSVHIADVSSYIQLGSPLDELAFSRATSFYLPTMTVPMLPPILSNDLCSLNAGEDRNTLSVIMYLDMEGHVVSHKIAKGLIRSRVKGIYSEVNAVLAGTAGPEIIRKYHKVLDVLPLMKELYQILRANRVRHGAEVKDSNLPEILISRDGIRLEPRREGLSENMIEEFMILANQVVSQHMFDHNLPSIFRAQDEKNHLAKYVAAKEGHASLALESYAHFTSPIRRLADLKIHQVLSMHLEGVDASAIHEVFDPVFDEVCDQATRKSRTAKAIETYSRKACYALFFSPQAHRRFEATIVRFTRQSQCVLCIAPYNVTVVAPSIHGRIGDRFTVFVRADVENHSLYALNVYAAAA